MTAVFEFLPDADRYQSLIAVSDKTYERLRGLEQQAVGRWTPPNLRWIGATTKGDFPHLAGHFPVVSDRALEVLKPLLGRDTDVLKLNVPGGGYAGLHVRDFPDCLDTERSDIRWLAPGRAYDVIDYEFRPEAVKGHHLFRLPQLSLVRTFLSDKAMDLIEEAGLKGLIRKKLWEG